MQKYTFFLSVVAVLLVSCGPKKPSVAELKLEKHRKDSLALIQYERTIAYCDSLVLVLQEDVNALLPQFKYEKQDRYEDHGRYVHKLLRTDLNTERCYLQVYVTDDFHLILKSHYKGTTPLHIQSIELQVDSLTQLYPGDTHEFEAEGYYEITTLNEANAIPLLTLIDANSASRERIRLVGTKSSYRFYLSDRDKQALIETYRLAVLMKDIHQLEQQSRQASDQVLKYQKRLEK